MRWFPDRTFIVTTDGGYATHEPAEPAARSGRRPPLISVFHPNANLVGPAPEYSGYGRPRVKGQDLAAPAQVVSHAITSVRRWLWLEWVLAIAGHRGAFQKLAHGLRRIVLNGLAPAS